MNDILNQIVSVNNLIKKALNSSISVGNKELNELLNMAYALKGEASLPPSTEYDLLVDNIEKLEGKLGISKQTPRILTPHGDVEKSYEWVAPSIRDQDFYIEGQGPARGKNIH